MGRGGLLVKPVREELAGARRSRSAINSKVGGGLLWGEVGSLLILRIIDAFQHSFYNSIDDYLPTEPPLVQDFLLLEKSRLYSTGITLFV